MTKTELLQHKQILYYRALYVCSELASNVSNYIVYNEDKSLLAQFRLKWKTLSPKEKQLYKNTNGHPSVYCYIHRCCYSYYRKVFGQQWGEDILNLIDQDLSEVADMNKDAYFSISEHTNAFRFVNSYADFYALTMRDLISKSDSLLAQYQKLWDSLSPEIQEHYLDADGMPSVSSFIRRCCRASFVSNLGNIWYEQIENILKYDISDLLQYKPHSTLFNRCNPSVLSHQ